MKRSRDDMMPEPRGMSMPSWGTAEPGAPLRPQQQQQQQRPVPPARQEFRLVPPPSTCVHPVQQAVLALVFGGELHDPHKYLGDRPELPGPLAVTLSRRTLGLVEREPYVVCEKSDGERAMLLAVGGPGHWKGVPPGAYLVNRSFGVSTFPGAAEYAGFLSPPVQAPAGASGSSSSSGSGAGSGPTLLDGELIQRPDDGGSGTGARAVYLVFDAIAVHGAPVGRDGFDARMAHIGRSVRAPFRAADDRLVASGLPGLPLYVMGKFFAPADRVGEVLARIFTTPAALPHEAAAAPGGGRQPGIAPLESEMGSGGAPSASSSLAGHSSSGSGSGGCDSHRVYRHDIRVNGTDGLVFTPLRASYTDMFKSGAPSCPLPLLKWKFADENTVDFRLTRADVEAAADAASSAGAHGGPYGSSSGSGSSNHGGGSSGRTVPVTLFLSGGRRGGQEVDLNVARSILTLAQADGYLALMDRLGTDSLVVEAAYDTASSGWGIRRVRDRKTRANYIATGWQTLEVLAEGITPGELARRLQPPAPPPPPPPPP